MPLSDDVDLLRQPGRRQQRVAAHVHGRGARVGRLTAKGEAVALDAVGAQHRAQRQLQALQHRPLLDVQLDVGAGVFKLRLRLGRVGQDDADPAERRAQTHAVPVTKLGERMYVNVAAGGARTVEAAAKAGALLVGPVNQADGHGRFPGVLRR